MTQAAWLWLPLLLVACMAIGFYRSYVDSGSASGVTTLCPQDSHLDRLLRCP